MVVGEATIATVVRMDESFILLLQFYEFMLLVLSLLSTYLEVFLPSSSQKTVN